MQKAQICAARATAAYLRTLDPGLTAGLCFRDDPACIAPDHAILVAEPDSSDRLEGRIALINRHGFLRPSTNGRPARSLGPLSTIPLAMLVGNYPVLCDRTFASVRNPDGSTGAPSCDGGRGLVPVGEAFARSLDLPWSSPHPGMPIATSATWPRQTSSSS